MLNTNTLLEYLIDNYDKVDQDYLCSVYSLAFKRETVASYKLPLELITILMRIKPLDIEILVCNPLYGTDIFKIIHLYELGTGMHNRVINSIAHNPDLDVKVRERAKVFKAFTS